MAYSRSKSALTRVQLYLNLLLNANEGEDVAFSSEDSVALAQRLREALYVATLYPEFNHYLPLRAKYHFKARPNKVIAEWKNKSPESPQLIQQQLSKMTISDVVDVMGIVGACIKHKATEIYFPDAQLQDKELESLYTWAVSSGYSIVDNADAGITLTKNDVGELAWAPQKDQIG